MHKIHIEFENEGEASTEFTLSPESPINPQTIGLALAGATKVISAALHKMLIEGDLKQKDEKVKLNIPTEQIEAQIVNYYNLGLNDGTVGEVTGLEEI